MFTPAACLAEKFPEMVLFSTVTVPPSLNTPPPRPAVLPAMVLCVTVRVPWFSIPAPYTVPPRRTVVSWSISSPVLPTFKIRSFGASLARTIVLPRPTMVMALVITGNPVRPKVSLSTVCRVCVLPTGSTMRSAPRPAGHPPMAVSVLAALMASTSVQAPPTGIVAARPGCCPRASMRAMPARGSRHCRWSARRTRRGRARSWVS